MAVGFRPSTFELGFEIAIRLAFVSGFTRFAGFGAWHVCALLEDATASTCMQLHMQAEALNPKP